MRSSDSDGVSVMSLALAAWLLAGLATESQRRCQALSVDPLLPT